jgi:hypothetical protein
METQVTDNRRAPAALQFPLVLFSNDLRYRFSKSAVR